MKRSISIFTLAIMAFGWNPMVQAMGRRAIDCDVARQGFTVRVAQGIGVDLRLNCGGDITDAQVSDPSRVVVRKRGPQHLYIKTIAPVSFQGNLHALDGTTMLSVVTSSGDVFQFLLAPVQAIASYSFLDIGGRQDPVFPTTTTSRPSRKQIAPIARIQAPVVVPPAVSVLPAEALEDNTPLPLVSKPIVPLAKATLKEPPKVATPTLPAPVAIDVAKPVPVIAAQVKTTPPKIEDTHSQANALIRGLLIAKQKRQIGYQSATWMKVQDVVYRLRNGQTIAKASYRSGVALSLIERLLAWGSV
ncbi:MAG: hypothetical protein WCD18_15615 [Thermosynechococcaceae cyanobacterium]